MRISFRKAALAAAVLVLVPIILLTRARGSDHADTPEIARQPGLDLTDVFVFPSPTNPNNVVLAMCVHPLIPSGTTNAVFDPNVLYQFKIDNNGDSIEDLVIQAKFVGSGASQQVQISSGVPLVLGTTSQQLTPDPMVGPINQTFLTAGGIKVFAGEREDPFFFDLAQFFTILPDRASPVFSPTFTNTSGTSVSTSPPDPDQPMAGTWRPAGVAQDFLKGLNVLSIVVELPKSQLTGSGTGKIGVWCTTSK